MVAMLWTGRTPCAAVMAIGVPTARTSSATVGFCAGCWAFGWLMRWGLVPAWVKDPRKFTLLINARSETIREKPAFKNAIKRRRCLIPADWFYEWKATPAGKEPYLVRMASREPFLIGGLWDTWHYGRDDALATFTVLTCVPNELTGTLHDRMPLIIEPDDVPRWLDRNEHDVRDLLRSYPAEEMTAHRVGTRVNSAQNDDPDLIEPIA